MKYYATSQSSYSYCKKIIEKSKVSIVVCSVFICKCACTWFWLHRTWSIIDVYMKKTVSLTVVEMFCALSANDYFYNGQFDRFQSCALLHVLCCVKYACIDGKHLRAQIFIRAEKIPFDLPFIFGFSLKLTIKFGLSQLKLHNRI